MSGVIAFADRSEDTWLAAGWLFNSYLRHVRQLVAESAELTFILDQAMALHGLHFRLHATLGPRLVPSMLRVCDEIATGERLASVEGRTLDDRSQSQFRAHVAELRALILRHLPSSIE